MDRGQRLRILPWPLLWLCWMTPRAILCPSLGLFPHLSKKEVETPGTEAAGIFFVMARGGMRWDLGRSAREDPGHSSPQDCGTESEERDLGWLPGLERRLGTCLKGLGGQLALCP